MRLDKFLSQNNIASRSEIKTMIKKRLITVNSIPAQKPEQTVNELTDTICVKQKPVLHEPLLYFLLNKPAGYVSAVKDNLFPTVLDLLKSENRNDLFPVGRLDKNTEGLLLITNDGELSHLLLSPKKHVTKTYFAKVRGNIGDTEINAFQKGISIGEKKDTLPAFLSVLSKNTTQEGETISEISLSITEGKFHQVKRMFQAVNMKVLYLKRTAMGKLKLDDTLSTGSYIKIKKSDIIDE